MGVTATVPILPGGVVKRRALLCVLHPKHIPRLPWDHEGDKTVSFRPGLRETLLSQGPQARLTASR